MFHDFVASCLQLLGLSGCCLCRLDFIWKFGRCIRHAGNRGSGSLVVSGCPLPEMEVIGPILLGFKTDWCHFVHLFAYLCSSTFLFLTRRTLEHSSLTVQPLLQQISATNPVDPAIEPL